MWVKENGKYRDAMPVVAATSGVLHVNGDVIFGWMKSRHDKSRHNTALKAMYVRNSWKKSTVSARGKGRQRGCYRHLWKKE